MKIYIVWYAELHAGTFFRNAYLTEQSAREAVAVVCQYKPETVDCFYEEYEAQP